MTSFREKWDHYLVRKEFDDRIMIQGERFSSFQETGRLYMLFTILQNLGLDYTSFIIGFISIGLSERSVRSDRVLLE